MGHGWHASWEGQLTVSNRKTIRCLLVTAEVKWRYLIIALHLEYSIPFEIYTFSVRYVAGLSLGSAPIKDLPIPNCFQERTKHCKPHQASPQVQLTESNLTTSNVRKSLGPAGKAGSLENSSIGGISGGVYLDYLLNICWTVDGL